MTSNLLKRSLRAKVILGVVFPLLLILGAFTIIEYTHHQSTVLSNLSLLASLSGQVIESNLRHAMLNSDFTEVRSLLNTIGGSKEFKIVYVLDTTGRVIFAPNNEGVGARMDNSEADCQPCHRLPVNERPRSVVVVGTDGQRVFRTMNPIKNEPACAKCHVSGGRLLGLLLTDISMAPMEDALTADMTGNVLWWIGAIVITIIVVNLALSQFVLRRLERLAVAIAGLGQGKMPLPIVESQPDEIAQLATAFNVMAQQVEARNTENRELSDDLRRQSTERGELLKRLITAQEDERKRVARELHDELGQSLTGLALRTEALGRFIETDSDRAFQQLDQISGLINETTDRMYNLILDLRPSVLDDLGLAPALRDYAERLLGDTNIHFELDAGDLPERLPPVVETSLYRVFQETLSNVARHAGASQVRIRLARYDGTFEGQIMDNGRGFDLGAVQLGGHSPHGLGLMGIQERVTQCGGEVEIITQPGMGTQVNIRIPLGGGISCG